MRFTLFTILALCLLALIQASCFQGCGDYEPVCAKPKKDQHVTFGSKCVMENHNCKNPKDLYEVESDGECSGKVKVILS